jgi:hypothetical protein
MAMLLKNPDFRDRTYAVIFRRVPMKEPPWQNAKQGGSIFGTGEWTGIKYGVSRIPAR